MRAWAEYLGPRDDNKHVGKVTSKIGPFQTSFEGEATVNYDEVEKSVRVEGEGYDKKSPSRSKMAMTCQLSEISSTTVVCVSADIQLSGKIAQFGRTGLITEIAKALIFDFVLNTETELQQLSSRQENVREISSRSTARPVNGIRLTLLALKSRLNSLFAPGVN